MDFIDSEIILRNLYNTVSRLLTDYEHPEEAAYPVTKETLYYSLADIQDELAQLIN